ncbi:hypothetical protein H6501_03930 [Candidatus Woesearchaeota archaeon]|nr:hypothetical protein [Nanoarchaeota archaeon]MCB9370721.1 hypothetical protein [Candidatus Woesearchaeota archaeon]USN43797.1 MAG: hypothetical protein H6500_05405 [Candidatus Woesearchaeota archaeon]
MRLQPKYSFEFLSALSPESSETQNVQTFASLLSDKDRFLALLPKLDARLEHIEEKLAYPLYNTYDFYIVRDMNRASFSEPITIEYSIFPEEMILFLLKEVLKVSITDRFIDEEEREQTLLSFITYLVQTRLSELKLDGYLETLYTEAKKHFPNIQEKEFNFEEKTLKEIIQEKYEEQWGN